MKPFFSILIPVFNKEGQMNECIRSLKEQTFGDFEAIFINDGSTDGSAAEIERFCAEDERFRFTAHEKNSSVMAARCTGMKEAKGEYILFIDSDDIYSPDACESLHDLLEKNPVDIVRFDIIEEPEMRVRCADKFVNVMDAYMKGIISPTVWKNCYSKALTEKAMSRFKPFYSNMAEDLFLSAVFYDCAESFAELNKVLYHYQMGNGMSTVRKVTPEKMRRDMDSMLLVQENLFEYVEKYCPEYLDAAEYQMRRHMKYIFINGVWGCDDFVNIMDVLYELRGGKTQWLYEIACREAVPALVRLKYRLSDEKMKLVGAEFERFNWFD